MISTNKLIGLVALAYLAGSAGVFAQASTGQQPQVDPSTKVDITYGQLQSLIASNLAQVQAQYAVEHARCAAMEVQPLVQGIQTQLQLASAKAPVEHSVVPAISPNLVKPGAPPHATIEPGSAKLTPLKSEPDTPPK